jgi:glycosyltransferase involved in cell wall biosynthesis
VLDTLARGLVAAGHEVELVTTGDSTCPVPRTWTHARAMTEQLGNVAVELRHVLHAYGTLDAADFDIVHDHTVAGPVVSLQYPHTVVTTNHGPFDDHMVAVYHAVAAHVPIIAISHHHASTARDIPIARVIHHGIDESKYRVGDGSGGYLAFVGRMSPTKGVHEAIEVARRSGRPLVIAAKMREQLERDYFHDVVEPMLGGDVRYVGVVAGNDKVELFGRAAALVNPIRWDEPFGLCMIEAMACGTPVLVTPRGSAPEIVEDGVTGFVRGDVDGLVKAVAHIGSLDRRACRATVETRFSARRMVADHVTFYEHVLDAHTRRIA